MSGRRLRMFVLLGCAIGMTATAHTRVPQRTIAPNAEDFVPRPEVARTLALGFDSALADLYWLRAVQVVGREKQDPHRHGLYLGRLVDVVTTLNPWVEHPYRFAAIWLTGSPDEVRFGNTLLERGIEHHPDDWRNYFYLGFNHFYYLDDLKSARSALEKAIALEGSPVYLKRLVARLRANTDSLDTASAFLAELANEATSPRARRQYEDALIEIETERRARVLDAAREEYRKRTGRDIGSVTDLVQGRHRVLTRLPEEPNGGGWMLLDGSGRIVSTYYGNRYEPYLQAARYARAAEWNEPIGAGSSSE